jgi:hypothetical protein
MNEIHGFGETSLELVSKMKIHQLQISTNSQYVFFSKNQNLNPEMKMWQLMWHLTGQN